MDEARPLPENVRDILQVCAEAPDHSELVIIGVGWPGRPLAFPNLKLTLGDLRKLAGEGAR